ncbi:hypothetical protein [Rhizobium sp. CIAT894]|nr:hypothetical protein [Rhizobium sp. CIAT894]
MSTTVPVLLLSDARPGIAVAGALVAGFIKKNRPRHAALFMGIYA